jgi:DNA invertase Pin-like site-specific DNA recombinase
MSTAIAYLRISSDPKDLRLGVDRQRADMNEVAEAKGLDLVATYEDSDVSASTTRPETSEWRKVLRHLVEDTPDFLLCAEQDRLGRTLADPEMLEVLTASLGVTVLDRYGREVFEAGSDDWIYRAAAAKIEARKTGRRVKRAQAERVRSGKQPNGGRRAYGYAPNRLDKIEVECAVLESVARRIIAGESISSTVHWLNDTNVPTVSGARWSVQALKQILVNPRYVGDLAKPDSQRHYTVIGVAAWSPVFDRETFEKLQAALRLRLGKARGRPAVPTMLAGILFCGSCNHQMYRNRSGYQRGPDTYRCGVGGCRKVYRQMDVLDNYVAQYILDHADPFALAAERDRLNTELLGRKHEENRLAGRFEDSMTAYTEKGMIWLLPEVNKRRDEHEASKRRTEDARLAVERIAQVSEAGDRWLAGSVEDRRRWVRANVAVIVCAQVAPRSAFDPSAVSITLMSEVPAGARDTLL